MSAWWRWGRIARLARAIRGEDPKERIAAAVEASQIRGRRSRALLVELLGDRDPRMREIAAKLLGKRREAAAIPALQPLLFDPAWRRYANGTISYGVRCAALDALRECGWTPPRSMRLEVRTIVEEDTIANHERAVYMLGAGFAHCYGLPLARELGRAMFPFLWNFAWPVRRLLELHFGCRDAEDAAGVAFADVIDAIQRMPDDELARSVDDHLRWWIREEFAPYRFSMWELDNEALLRFLEFLAHNGLQNYVVTTNWDIFLDTAVQQVLRARDYETGVRPGTFWEAFASELMAPLRYVDYGIYRDLDSVYLGSLPAPIHLFKINGSADWLHCPGCRRIFSWFFPWRGFSLHDIHVDGFDYESFPQVLRCPSCEGQLHPVLMMPSPRRPQHLLSHVYGTAVHGIDLDDSWDGRQSVLSNMRERLAGATLWVFMGYSLPEYDSDVIDVIRGAMAASPPLEVHVVDFEPDFVPAQDSAVARHYREVFGREVRYDHRGIEAWIERHVPQSRSAHSM